MKILSSLISPALLAIAAVLPCTASAQDSGFDLSSQRGEVKTVNPVPGQKIDHHGIIINPIPQSLTRPYTGEFNLSGGFAVKDRRKAFQSGELSFLDIRPKGLEIDIDFGEKQAKKAGVELKDGAYALSIGPKKITLTGYNERGAYYGLQTLRQILESPACKNGALPMMEIKDFPALKYRGVVEGFYGTPWSHQARMSLLKFYGDNKLNDYLYGPKDDPYHSSPNWRLPYPPDEARNIQELVECAKRNRVNFVWAIHPGKDIRWTKEDYDSLLAKFNMMYDLGVRAFAVFFDDIDGIGTNPQKQVELLNDLTRDFVKAKGDVANLIVCPTDYSQLWAKPDPEGPLAVYGRDLNPDVEVFWTGAVVCSDLTPETLDFVNSRIKRPALYWWNYPVTDYCKHILMQGPVYGLDTKLTDEQVIGLLSNPMEHAEASKLALYGVADYAWNPAAFNPIDNWERGLEEIMPDAHEAYRLFAIHSTDTETGYRRDESWETETFPYNKYTPDQYNALKREFEEIIKVENAIKKGCTNPALLNEMKPWLKEFTALGERGLSTLRLIKTFEQGNDSIFWDAYLDNLMTPDQVQAYNSHKIGTMKLQPFYSSNMDAMLKAFYKGITGRMPAMYEGIGTFPYFAPEKVALMLDNDSTTFYSTEESQHSGSWLGLDLQQVRPVNEVTILQGRNSVDDTDYIDNVILEASADGKEWTPLTAPLKNTYEFGYKGEPVNARYVRMRRLDSDRTSWASVRTFHVNPLTTERLGNDLQAPDVNKAILAFDENPTTSFNLVKPISFARLQGADTLVLLMSNIFGKVTVTQTDSKGRVVELSTVNTNYSTVALSPKTTRIEISGHATVYELIQK